MNKKKRFVLALILLGMFCTVAVAASPQVDSILQEHSIIVPFFWPRTLFTITPEDEDVSWSISRYNGEEWEDATVSREDATPLQGEIGADEGTERIWWNFYNYGDYTAHDGGVTHRLDVSVDGEVVTQVDFDVTYIPALGLDYISLVDWKNEDDLKQQKQTTNDVWFTKQEACSFGPQFKDECEELTDEWYRFSVVDFSQQGTQVFDLIAADAWHIGYVMVTVDGDWAQVDYICSEDLNTADGWDQVYVYREFVTFFKSTNDVIRLNPRRIYTNFKFGEPFSISECFGEERVVMMYVNNLVSFNTANPYVTRFWRNQADKQDVLNAMKVLMKKLL